MKKITQIFSSKNGSLSSKRIIGTACIVFAMLFVLLAYYTDGTDIPNNVQNISLQFLIVGGGMITAGTFEKDYNKTGGANEID